jgi:hypothetical protein
MLEHIHSFLEKRPFLTLAVFLVACLGTCLVPVAGIRLSTQIEGESAQGTVLMLTSLAALVCLGTVTVLVIRSPLHPGPSPHDALMARGFTRKAKSEQQPTYFNAVAGRQVTVNCPVNNTTLALTIECSSRYDVIFWTGKTQAIVMPLNWLFGRRQVTGDPVPADVVCMARDIEEGRSLLENPQVRSMVVSLLTDPEIAAAHTMTISRKSISLTMGNFQTGTTITPDKLQQWIDALSSLAEVVEKQAISS